MYSKYFLIVCIFALIETSYSRPKSKTLIADSDSDAEFTVKEWESKKPEIPLIKQLEKSGVGIKRSPIVEEKKDEGEGTRLEVIENFKNSPSPDELGEFKSEEILLSEDKSSTRVKKQSPNNVCIKIGGCGKTVCGPMVSARGLGVGDMRTIIQNKPPMAPMDSIHPAAMTEMNEESSKIPPYSGMQGRTVDLMGLAPTLSLGYGTPAVYSAPVAPVAPASESGALAYGHTFVKPPSVSAVPAMPVAIITQHQPHPIVHPWLLPHLLPHVMPHLVPHLVPGLASFVTPHRFEPQRYQELPQPEVKQPGPSLAQFSYASPDTALICQPVRNQRFDSSYDFVYKPDAAIDKSLNVSEAAKKAQGSGEDDSKIQDHLRKVNEIKEEISQLNRAAQRIVDQQERLTEMQQKQLWSGSSPSSSPVHPSVHGSMHGADHPATPYMGSGYYAHPTMPWGYSRSNILSYPNTHDDIEFFLNLMRAGKKFGIISDSLQPVLSTVGEVIKGGQDSSKIEKSVTEASKSGVRMEEPKPSQTIKST